MKWLSWESFGCTMAKIWPSFSSWSGHMTSLSVLNQSQEIVEGSKGCCSVDWLVQLQQFSCPLVKLLILGLVALPVYNAILILVGWRLNYSASSSAERLVLDIHLAPVVKRPAPLPPTAPKPPPRHRRRKAPSIPVITSEGYTSQQNLFESNLQTDQYNNLREKLKVVLEGLQNPLPPPLPLFPPKPPVISLFVEPLSLPEPMTPSESITPSDSPRIESTKPRSKLLTGIFKRFGKRWKTRGSHKKPTTSEASTSPSNSPSMGTSCFYVY
ncbi:histone-lysine N-methyltransferase SETD1B [Drosophila eugracilis]|uniref:histone-lysine N-methyltransferase SETD1B n=1 Tax=Drosophila eugracilis TaxID=29029 RepID=UPI0007E73BAE|nr:histone-lysine N-methyltransferase SETD1B [Drosophila eugracilis]